MVGLARGGTDQVRSPVSHDLGVNVESLVLTGSAKVNGTGHDLANRVVGNAGTNLLRGGGGHDSRRGGVGKDRLDGGKGSDRVEGGTGDDRLRGVVGRDSFCFVARPARVLDGHEDADTHLFADPLWGGGARGAT